MHAMCILYQQAGREDDSLSLAQEALPFLLHHHNLKLSGEIYLAHLSSSAELNLNPDELMQLGDHLRAEGSEAGAVQAYTDVLEKNPTHAKAIKGIMKIADEMGQRGADRESAALYRYLLDQCAGSPLEEYMWQGLKKVEKKPA